MTVKVAICALVLILLGLSAPNAFANSPVPGNLDCRLGPVNRTFGKTPWYVYGCNDQHSIVIVTAPGNPAMPFFFFFVWTQNGYSLRGEGTGNKTVTDRAFSELSALKEDDVLRLYNEAASVGQSPAPGTAAHKSSS